MPVWLVLGVQSSARLILVNCFGAALLSVEQTEPGVTVICAVVGVPELEARCCQKNALTTTTTNSSGMPILKNKRVRRFIVVPPIVGTPLVGVPSFHTYIAWN